MGRQSEGFIQWSAPLLHHWDPRGLNHLVLVHPDSAKGHISSIVHFILPEGFFPAPEGSWKTVHSGQALRMGLLAFVKSGCYRFK